jgi:uncharacterized cupin superfamily protein
MEKKWAKQEIGALAAVTRVELKESLGMTGCEVSLNRLAPAQAIPFLHSHRKNEEVYLFLSGKGEFLLDREIVPVAEGSCVRVGTACARAIRRRRGLAARLCLRSVGGRFPARYTATDGVILDEKPNW